MRLNPTSQIQLSNRLEYLRRKIARVTIAGLSYEEMINLTVPAPDREVFHRVRKIGVTTGATDWFIMNYGGAQIRFDLKIGVRGLIPIEPEIQEDVDPELLKRVLLSAREHQTHNHVFGKARGLLGWFKDNNWTVRNIRTVWPSFAHLIDEELSPSLHKHLRGFTPSATAPTLPLAHREIIREANEYIGAAALIPLHGTPTDDVRILPHYSNNSIELEGFGSYSEMCAF